MGISCGRPQVRWGPGYLLECRGALCSASLYQRWGTLTSQDNAPLKGDLAMNRTSTPRRGKRLIFRAWRTIDGRLVHASEYGLKAWPMWV